MALSGAASITPVWAQGLCSGTTNLFGDASTDNFIGMHSSGAWSYSGGTTAYTTGAFNFVKRVGNTTTVAGGSSGYDLGDISMDSMCGSFCDILRTSVGNFKVEIVFMDSTPTVGNSMTDAVFDELCRYNANLNAKKPGTYYYETSGNITLDESTYPLNAVNLHWSGSTTKLVIDKLTVSVWD
jgi:hypothetical protein